MSCSGDRLWKLFKLVNVTLSTSLTQLYLNCTNKSNLTLFATMYCVLVSGYGAQAGPTNGQPMKGNGMNHAL